jgi:ferric-dicitrate binding protein FerR (iron transport regulator)
LQIEPTHIDNLIAKYLAREASPTEEKQVMAWMDASPENKKYFGDIQFVHQQAIASQKYQKVDVDKAWNTLHSQMVQSPNQSSETVVKVPFYQSLWFKVAASVIFITGLFTVLYTEFRGTGSEAQAIVITSADSTLSQTIAQNTKVVLNRNSKIIYHRIPKRKQIEIILTGEAFIDIEHPKDTAFIVKANETFIRDIGTSFNVKAYPADQTIEVFVESGEVSFYTAQLEGIVLKAGETGVYHKDLKKFEKIENKVNAIAYKTRSFVFRNSKLSEVINALNAVYPETIAIDNTKLADCKITVTFDNESLEAIAEIIAETLGLQLTVQESHFILSGKNCLNY